MTSESDRNGSKDPGLAPETQALLAHERVPPALPDDVRARLLSRANAAVLEGPPALQPAAARGLFGKPLVLGAAAAVVAAAIVAAVAWRAEPVPNGPVTTASVPSALPSAVPAPTLAPSAVVTPPAPSAISTFEELPTAKARSSASSREANGLDEIQLLARARKDDARRDYASVLSALSEHERSFPAGRLSEEREVLRVKALVGLGRTEEARRAAAKFRRRFPRSVLLDTVEQMLPSAP